MGSGQDLKCLFGDHIWFTSGCVRQCDHCKVVEVYDYKNPRYWIKLENQSKDYDLRAILNITKFFM